MDQGVTRMRTDENDFHHRYSHSVAQKGLMHKESQK